MTVDNKGTGGFFQVKANEWDRVNEAFRYFCNMIDMLTGRRGKIQLQNDIDLNGHQIIGLGDPGTDGSAVSVAYGDEHYSTSTTRVTMEVPTGSVDGTNNVFVLANEPISGTLALYVRGILQEPDIDYVITGQTVTMTLPPLSGSYIRAFYEH